MKQNLFLPKTALAFLMALFSVTGWGQILGWQFGNPQSSGNELTYDATTVNTNLESSSLSRGNGINETGLQRAFSSNGFESGGTKAQAESGNKYFQFTVKAKSNYKVSLSTLDARLRRTAAAPNAYIWKYSLDGTNFTEIGTQVSFTSTADGVTQAPIDLTNIVSLQNVPNTITITFRLYAWGASGGNAGTATFAVGRYGSGVSTNSLSIGGTVDLNSVPVPTWNGGPSWDNGTPTASTPAVINANYTGGSFEAQSVTVNSGFTLNVNTGVTVATGNITNNGAIVVNDGGNLLQTSATSTYTAGTGATFTVNKAYATNVAGKYAFWSSPVQNQNMFNAFTAQPADVTTYNTATNYYDAVTNFTNNSGKGYSIQMPVGGSASFVGTPNNGNVSVALSNASFGYNLVGNPYPSNLNLPLFLTGNSGNIDPTFYFWDNTSAPVANQTGQTSANYGYATFNANGTGTWAPAQNISGGTGNNIDLTNATPQINPGQGFIVKSLTGTSLVFNNGMRSADAGTFVNKNGNSSSEGKYWLKLKTPLSANNTLAVTYGEGATNAVDGFDSKAMALGSDAFYSKVSDNKLAIQGRTDFVNTDVVPLGSKHFTDGLHTISLANKTGVFNNGQAIYLHDKVLGTYTNLQNTSYNFTVNAGEIADRFEVVYLLGTLSTSEAQKGSFEIYRDGNDFYARNNKNIESVEVFDASGRKIQEMNPASQLVRIPLDSKGFYIIKAKSAGKEYSKKITY